MYADLLLSDGNAGPVSIDGKGKSRRKNMRVSVPVDRTRAEEIVLGGSWQVGTRGDM